jgi:YfiR/HmsC-like
MIAMCSSGILIRHHRAYVAALMTWGLLVVQNLDAQLKPTEYQVKAAYLSNFGRFVEWRARVGNEPFKVCVLGPDPFGPALDATVSGESIDHAPVEAKRIAGAQEAGSCRILFISSAEDTQLRAILTALDKTSVLTVSDIPQFAKRGGMIQFILIGNRVRFEVNLDAAQRAGLSLSSELLKLATTVRRAP